MSLPGFYEPSDVGRLYVERVGAVGEDAMAARRARGTPPAHPRTVVFGIDCQVAFCHPQGSLYVPGAEADVRRAVEWIYRHADAIDGLVFSMDTHASHQIFHAAWWEDAEGRPPAPLTVIRAADVRSGRWRPRFEPEASLEYCERLEATGRYVLTIWPYHALLGGVNHALLPALAEAALWHAVYSDAPSRFVLKGREPLTEMYSVFEPEVKQLGGRSVGAFDEDLYEHLVSFDRIVVFGEAKSHCVLATLESLLARMRRDDPALIRRVYVLEDAMSPVPPPPLDPLPPDLDFPAVAERAFAEFARAGVHRITTTADWP